MPLARITHIQNYDGQRCRILKYVKIRNGKLTNSETVKFHLL